MKTLLFSAASLLIVISSIAQNQPRMVGFRVMANDSINLALNDDYNLIEDSCATIIRHAHYNSRNRYFFGKFTDVSKLNPSLILSAGNYTTEGLKDGEFISRYANGNLRFKGSYKNDKPDGKWEINYGNDKPEMTFEADNGSIKIFDIWNDKGIKTVENGKGKYVINLGLFSWSGKLNNGYPDGNWTASRTVNGNSSTVNEELFKNGKFVKGKGILGDYTESRITLINPNLLPFTAAEKMTVSTIPCNGSKPQIFKSAYYHEGTFAYNEEIKKLISVYLSKTDIRSYNDKLELEGVISENGIIYDLQNRSAFSEEIARGLINQLRRLPSLMPATLDNKPVKQHVTFIFTFYMGSYTFSYQFSPFKTVR